MWSSDKFVLNVGALQRYLFNKKDGASANTALRETVGSRLPGTVQLSAGNSRVFRTPRLLQVGESTVVWRRILSANFTAKKFTDESGC